MRYIWSYLKRHLRQFILATGLSFAAGLGLMLSLRELNEVIKDGLENTLMLTVTVLLGLAAYVILGQIAERILAKVSYLTILEMRLDLVKKIYSATFHKIEGRKSELFSSLVTDTQFIGRKLEKTPTVVRNLVISFGGICYLLFISWQMSSLLMLVFASVGLLIFMRNKRAYHLTKNARQSFDKVYDSLHDSINGMKELSQDVAFRNRYFSSYVKQSSYKEADLKVKLRTHNQLTNHIAEASLILGILIMVLLVYQLSFGSKSVLIEFIAISLFIVKPVSSVTDFIKGVLPVAAITDHIQKIGLDLKNPNEPKEKEISSKISNNNIILNDVCYTYPGKHYPTIDYLSATINSGEITLIFGGNGSGKTTLAKIISGLYTPDSGSVTVNNQLITDSNRTSYRSKIASVFTDGHLFKNQQIKEDQLEAFKQYLKLMDLEETVQLDGNQIRTDNLSTGQGKRLLLILSILADKSIYLFDEWAANQDPEFKQAFYFRVLPELKEKGKTIVLITHDDQFFNIADTKIKISNGKAEEYQLV